MTDVKAPQRVTSSAWRHSSRFHVRPLFTDGTFDARIITTTSPQSTRRR